MEVVNLVFGGSELFEDTDILAGAPDGVDRNIELQLATEKQRKLGERQFAWGESRLDGARATLLDGLFDWLRDQGRVLGNMLQRLLDDSVQRCVIVETKITGVDDVIGTGLLR